MPCTGHALPGSRSGDRFGAARHGARILQVNKHPHAIRTFHVEDEPDFAETTATFLEYEDDRFHIETAVSPASDFALPARLPKVKVRELPT